MKKVNFNKLYDGLTVQERAKMTFEALISNDIEAAKQIANSVTRETYRMVDVNFRNTLGNYFSVAHIWSAEYWRCSCKLVAGKMSRCGYALSNEWRESISEQTSLDDLCNEVDFWQDRLVALGLILKKLEDSYSLDISKIIMFSGAEKMYGLDSKVEHLEGDAKKYYEMYLAQFISFIDGSEVTHDVEEYFKVKTRH